MALNPRTGTPTTDSPVLVTDYDGVYQYGIVIRTDYGVTVFRRTIATDVYTTFDLSTTGLLNLPINPVDDHWALAIGYHRSASGDVLYIAGNNHGDGGTYLGRPAGTMNRIRSAVGPDITSWTDLGSPASESATGGESYTYYRYHQMADGTLLWFHDQSEAPGDSRGRDWLAYKQPLNATLDVLTPLITGVEFAQTDHISISHGGGYVAETVVADNPGALANRVYVQGIHSLPSGRVWVWGIWRIDDANEYGQCRPWCIYSDDLATWKSVTGQTQTMPIRIDNMTTNVEVPVAPLYSIYAGANMTTDSLGYPHFIVVNQDDATAWVELYWTGVIWASRAVSGPGSGRPGVYNINGTLYTCVEGTANAGRRTRMRNLTTNKFFYIGDQSVSTFNTEPDVSALRDRGIFQVIVPDTNTPHVWSWGKGSRRRK